MPANADTTYPYLYNGQRLTLTDMRSKPTIARIETEMWRRLTAMMEAAHDAGVDLGIGGAWRSSNRQLTGFLDRHSEVTFGGCCKHNGKRYSLKRGAAHMAPPGKSYHESTAPDGSCLAVDMVSSDGHIWMNANCHRFGLRHFGGVNGEKWHVQPVDVPSARINYSPVIHHPLNRHTLPTAVTAPRPTLRRGAIGAAVTEMQILLSRHGYPTTVDGVFGPRTETALRSFQAAQRLHADAICGPKTWGKLLAANPAT